MGKCPRDMNGAEGCQDLVYFVKPRYWRPKPAVGSCIQGLSNDVPKANDP